MKRCINSVMITSIKKGLYEKRPVPSSEIVMGCCYLYANKVYIFANAPFQVSYKNL